MSSLGNFVKRLRDIMRQDAGINGDAQRIEQIAWLLFLKVYDTQEETWEYDDDEYESIIPEDCRWKKWAGEKDKDNHIINEHLLLTGDDLLDFVNNKLFPTLKSIESLDL
jgi:Type I restriction-modification system methyltransferase subunit